MMFKLIVLLLLSFQAILSLELSQRPEERDVIYHTNSYDDCSSAEPSSSPIRSTIISSKAVFTSWPNSTSVSTTNSSIGTGSTKSHLSQATTVHGSAPAATTTKKTTTYNTLVPGKNGTPACAYVVAADIGAEALCTEDYCNCDGTAAPLLTSQVSVSGIWTTNCAYTTQPATDACPVTAGGPLLPLASVAGTVTVTLGVTTVTL